jgi:hypothetical protein
MTPKTLAARIRPYFIERRLVVSRFLGLSQEEDVYLMIPKKAFDLVIQRALVEQGLDEFAKGENYPIRYPIREPAQNARQSRQVQSHTSDVVAGLVRLGYKQREAEQAATGLSGDLETQMREALKRMAK